MLEKNTFFVTDEEWDMIEQKLAELKNSIDSN